MLILEWSSVGGVRALVLCSCRADSRYRQPTNHGPAKPSCCSRRSAQPHASSLTTASSPTATPRMADTTSPFVSLSSSAFGWTDPSPHYHHAMPTKLTSPGHHISLQPVKLAATRSSLGP
ncbi:hypothetical protein HDK64DRAFT_143531 [Phyllosticta capitalensis]